jgi:hypothetical protein
VPAQCTRGSLRDNESLHPVFSCEDSRCFVFFQEKSICFLKQKAVGSQLVLRASTRPSRSPYCSGATPQVRLCDALFSDVASTYQEHSSITSLLDLPLVSIYTFLEGVLVLPDSGQVGGPSSNDGTLSSLQAPGPALEKLDVHLCTRSGEFSFLILVHPTRPHWRHIFTSHRPDIIYAASPTRRSGA